MPAADPAQLIDHARRCVCQAVQQWNAADFKRVSNSRRLLEQSVADIRMGIDLLRNGASTMTNDFQPMIVALRRDISMMVRLVDACSAFHRGLALRRGGVAPAYDATGRTIGDPGGLPPHGVIG